MGKKVYYHTGDNGRTLVLNEEQEREFQKWARQQRNSKEGDERKAISVIMTTYSVKEVEKPKPKKQQPKFEFDQKAYSKAAAEERRHASFWSRASVVILIVAVLLMIALSAH